MSEAPSYSINVGGELLSLEAPIVMGILNATPDSFYQHDEGADAIRLRTRQMLSEGATIVDVGACSTRPGYTPPDGKEEMRRLREALALVRDEAPKAIVAWMVNDISEGALDDNMFKTVAELHVPYILTHNKALPEGEQEGVSEFLRDMGRKTEELHELGVCDIILDPGFGFGKTLEQNYILMRDLEVLHELHLPLLVGVSHKSMIYKLLGTTPDGAMNGTTVLHTVALQKGAHILRTHEVREAMECITIVEKLKRE